MKIALAQGRNCSAAESFVLSICNFSGGGFSTLRFSEAERGYNGAVPYPPRYYGENDLHYLTTSTYRGLAQTLGL